MSSTEAEYETPWSIVRDAAPRRARWLLVGSLLVHLLLTPLGALLGLDMFLAQTDEPRVEEPALDTIAVSIFDEETGPERIAEPSAPVAPPAPAIAEPGTKAAETTTPIPKPTPSARSEQKRFDDASDAGAPPAPVRKTKPGEDGPDGGAPQWPAERPAETAKPTAKETKPAQEGTSTDQELALRKVRGKNTLSSSNANVELVLFSSVIRAHSLGARVGALMKRLPQWRSFFVTGGVDPIRDFDTLHASGPQFRDSSNIAVLIRHHLGKDVAKGAVQALVDNPRRPGRWLENTQVPSALAWADRAERLFVLSRAEQMVVAPPALADAAQKVQPLLPLTGGEGVAMLAKVVTPHRVFLNLPVQTPPSFESVKVLRASVLARPTGAVKIELRAEDASEDAAKKNTVALREFLDGVAGLAGVANLAQGIGRYFGGAAAAGPKIPPALGRALSGAEIRAQGKWVLVDLELAPREVNELFAATEGLLVEAGY